MCMKTKGEKSDILEGPRMLMKNKPLNLKKPRYY